MRKLGAARELIVRETHSHSLVELGRQTHLYLNQELHRGGGYSPLPDEDRRTSSNSPSVMRLVRDTTVRPERKDSSWPL